MKKLTRPEGWTKVEWALIGVVLTVCWLLVFAGTAWPQSDLEGLLGHHPTETPDPYHHAEAVDGMNCCHGRDCVRYLGDVEKVPGGWQAGPWFVPDRRAIKPETLARKVRGIYTICFSGGRANAIRYGKDATVYCGYFPESGT